MPPGGLEGLLGGLGMGPGALDNIWENPMVTSSSFELQYIKSLQMCSRQYFEYFLSIFLTFRHAVATQVSLFIPAKLSCLA